MRRLLAFMVLAGAMCFGQSINANYPTLPLVQIFPPQDGHVATSNKAITAGNLLVIGYDWENEASMPTIASSRCASWTQLDYHNYGPGGVSYIWWACIATSSGSGSDTVTVTESGASYEIIEGSEMPPICTVTLDGTPAHAYVSGGAPSTITSPNITTTLNSDCVFTLIGGIRSNGADWVSTTGWLQDGFYSGHDSMAMAFTISGTPGTYNATSNNRGQRALLP